MIGERVLQRLDSLYHEGRLPVIGAIFCDLWDWNAGMPFWPLMQERFRKIVK